MSRWFCLFALMIIFTSANGQDDDMPYAGDRMAGSYYPAPPPSGYGEGASTDDSASRTDINVNQTVSSGNGGMPSWLMQMMGAMQHRRQNQEPNNVNVNVRVANEDNHEKQVRHEKPPTTTTTTTHAPPTTHTHPTRRTRYSTHVHPTRTTRYMTHTHPTVHTTRKTTYTTTKAPTTTKRPCYYSTTSSSSWYPCTTAWPRTIRHYDDTYYITADGTYIRIDYGPDGIHNGDLFLDTSGKVLDIRNKDGTSILAAARRQLNEEYSPVPPINPPVRQYASAPPPTVSYSYNTGTPYMQQYQMQNTYNYRNINSRQNMYNYGNVQRQQYVYQNNQQQQQIPQQTGQLYYNTQPQGQQYYNPNGQRYYYSPQPNNRNAMQYNNMPAQDYVFYNKK